jgi:tetratricopeptide (TPR) repeat protein
MAKYGIFLSLLIIAIPISPAEGQTADSKFVSSDRFNDLYEEAADLYDAGRASEALAILRRINDHRPDSPMVHNGLCVAFSRAGESVKAIASCQQAIRLNPQFANPYYNLGVIYESQGQYADALAALQRAISLKPNFPAAFYTVAGVYAAQGREQEAVTEYLKAIHLKADYAQAYCGLSASYFNLKRYEDSASALQQTIKLNPDFLAYKNLGVVYIALGEFRAAADAFANAIELDRNKPSTYRYLGYSYQKLGKKLHARAAYLSCLQLQPDDAETRYLLGMLAISLTNRTEALQQIKALQKLDSTLAQRLYAAVYADKIVDVRSVANPP